MSTRIFMIHVEGHGLDRPSAPGTPRRYRFATGVLDDDPDGVYLPLLEEIGGEIGFGVNFTTGEAEISGRNFVLQADNEVLKRFWTDADSIDQLQDSIDESDTQIQLIATNLEGTFIALGREVIFLENHVGGGLYDCDRGRFLTDAVPHGVGLFDDTAVFFADENPFPYLRVVEFRSVYSNQTYDDEVVHARYVVDDIDTIDEDASVVIMCNSYLASVKERVIFKELTRFEQSNYWGPDESWASYTSVEGQKRRTPATGTVNDDENGEVLLSLDGKTALVARAASWSSKYFFAIHLAGGPLFPERKPRYIGNAQQLRSPYEFPDEAHECFCANEDAPTKTGVASDTDTLPFSTRIAELIANWLTSSNHGTNNSNNTDAWDADMADRRLGLGIPARFIDWTSFRRFLNEVPTAYVDALWMAVDGEPMNVWQAIKEILQPYSAAFSVGPGGLFVLVRRRDAAKFNETLDPITDGKQIQWFKQTRNLGTGIDQVEVIYNDRPGKGPVVDTFDAPVITERNLGSAASVQITARGIKKKRRVTAIAYEIVDFWQKPTRGFSMVVPETIDKWPGDIVTVSGALLYDTDGTRGITNEVCQVEARSAAPTDGQLTLDLSWVGSRYKRAGFIAPSARIQSFSSPTITCYTRVFTQAEPASDPDWERDTAAFKVGDRVQILNPDLSLKESGLIISAASESSDDITFSPAPGTVPADGDILTIDEYTSYQTSDELSEWAFLSENDTSGLPGGDESHQWTQ